MDFDEIVKNYTPYPSDYAQLTEIELIFSIFENFIILFEANLPKKIIQSQEFTEIKEKLDCLYDKIKIENL
jgi:hypothetical protein